MKRSVLIAGALCGMVSASSVFAAGPPAWALNFNTQINAVNPATNNEFPFLPSAVQSDSLAANPIGILYVADAGGTIYSVQGATPLGNVGMGQIADLHYDGGGLWGFSNANDTLFFFDLTTWTVTFSQAITSGLGANTVTGVTRNSTGDIYLSGYTAYNNDSLFMLSGATANLVGTMTHGDAFSYISDIEFDAADNLIAMTWYHRDFYMVDPTDASTALISAGPHRDVTGLALDTATIVTPPTEPVPEVGTLVGAAVLAGLVGRRFFKRS
jgi:hypothetical protein